MKRHDLPPLNGLRAFEAAARHCSLSLASEELGVTASAVGHQIRGLEKNLGVRLFDRQAKRLNLTQTGERFADALTHGFDLLHRATESVRRQHGGRPITVSATPAMALRWLALALDQLRQEGFAEFRIDASSRTADLGGGEADLDIRYGREVESGLVSHVLFSEAVFPVCERDVAKDLKPGSPSDLARARLLYVDDWGTRGGVWSAWTDWFAECGCEIIEPEDARRFTILDKAVEAAALGEGIAMGANRHLDAHAGLVRLFPEAPEINYSAFLVALPEVAEDPTIRRLIRRLTALANKSTGILHEGAF